jgi:hypothetical protein
MTDREREQAIKEAHNIAASEAYFEVRAEVVYPQPHTIFDGGFSRGWDAGRAPLLERIAGLEQEVQRFQSDAVNEKAARQELERQLEQARGGAIEELSANLAEALMRDCDHGVKWLNEKYANDFKKMYPLLCAAIQAEVKP